MVKAFKLLFAAILALASSAAYADRIVNAYGFCLDVHNDDSTKNGARVQIWKCNDQLNQDWRFHEGRLVNGRGLCLDVHNDDRTKKWWQSTGMGMSSWVKPTMVV